MRSSFSNVSLRVIISQKMPAIAKKNKKIRNSLFVRLNMKLLTERNISLTFKMLGVYFWRGVVAISLNTEPLSTVTTTSCAIFTSTVLRTRSMLFTVP